jgi:hypothetical protein
MGVYYDAEVKNNRLASDALKQKYEENRIAYEEALAIGDIDAETMNRLTDAYL